MRALFADAHDIYAYVYDSFADAWVKYHVASSEYVRTE